MHTWVWVGFGGFAGSVCRYLMSLLPFANRSGFPFATFAVNIAGAFLIGLLAGLSARVVPLRAEWLVFLRVGFCGGFTTFSTFALDITGMLENGRMWACVAYITLSVLLSVLAVLAGRTLVS